MSALAWALSAGVFGTMAAIIWGAFQRGGRIGAEKDFKHTVFQLDQKSKELVLAQAKAEDGFKQFREMQLRYETAQADFFAELAKMEEVLSVCQDPAALRARWLKLFPRRPAAAVPVSARSPLDPPAASAA